MCKGEWRFVGFWRGVFGEIWVMMDEHCVLHVDGILRCPDTHENESSI